jgi:hypothetical protein
MARLSKNRQNWGEGFPQFGRKRNILILVVSAIIARLNVRASSSHGYAKLVNY